MAMSPSNPMRKYSWWWDSHISPKNSKWLQENLTDTDSKIKVMIMIIDEEADSFARRAEMYYKRRPELMSLLEELYRAYRALAERYDHVSGELRQANRRIAEAFPDKYQLHLDDDLPIETAYTETETDSQQSSDRLLPTKEEFKRLKEEMQSGLLNLSTTEERCLQLEIANQNLHLELDKLKHASKEKHDELNEKCFELEKLSITIQEEQLKSMQAEMARLCLEKQLAQAQEKLRLVSLEKLGEASKINDIEETEVLLQNELENIREGKWKLVDQNHSSTSAIIRLQDEAKKKKSDKELTNSGMTLFHSIQNQIALLVEEVRRRENQLQEAEHKIVEAHTEIFILQKCLSDMAEANSDVLAKLQKQQETCKVQEERVSSLSQNNQKLTKGIGFLMEVLHLDEKYGSLDLTKIDVVVQLVLLEIKCLLNTISDAQDVNQNQILEKSFVATLLEHFGREVADLRSERSVLKQEWQAKNEELLQLQSERHDLLKISCELQKEMEAHNRTVDELKSKAKFLVRQNSELHESRQSLQAEFIKLIEDNSSLSSKLYDPREQEKSSEDDISILLGETVKTDILCVIFRSLHEERTSQLWCLHEDFGSLQAAGNELYQEIKLMNKKLGDLQLENNILEMELSRTLSIYDGSSGQLLRARRRTMRRDTKLLKSGRKSQENSMNTEQRNKIDNAGLDKSNEMLRKELPKLQSELQVSRRKDQPVIDVKSCDAEITKLLASMQLATANAALFKEKVLELIVVCESFEISDMVQKEVLKEATWRNSYVDELKDKLNAVIENRRLKVDLNGDFTILEALQTEVSALEEQTLSLAKDCLPPHMLKEEENQMSPQLSKICVKPSEDQNATKVVKDMELKKLHGTIKALQKVVSDTGVVLEQERLDFNSNLQDARKHIEILKLKEMLDSDAGDTDLVTEMEPHRELKKKVIDRLSLEARRLDRRSSVESSADSELEAVNAQMVEAGDTIAKLIDAIAKLLKKAEEFTSWSRSQCKILERGRKMSEKVGRLELDLQRFQHALLKHEEERAAGRAAKATAQVQRRSPVQLAEYLYGRRCDSLREKQKQCVPSSCMRAKAIDD